MLSEKHEVDESSMLPSSDKHFIYRVVQKKQNVVKSVVVYLIVISRNLEQVLCQMKVSACGFKMQNT